MGRRKYPPIKCDRCGLPVSRTYFGYHYAKYHMEDKSENTTANTVKQSELLK